MRHCQIIIILLRVWALVVHPHLCLFVLHHSDFAKGSFAHGSEKIEVI